MAWAACGLLFQASEFARLGVTLMAGFALMKISWGILGTGRIAKRLAKAIEASTTGSLAAVASRDSAKAEAFAKEFGVGRSYGNYTDLLADPGVDAVYIATPHPQHPQWAIAAARAGKHVLCEKPAALSYAEAEPMVTAARENGVIFMEAFMYRCHPQTRRVLDLIREGAIGELKLIECSFGFQTGYVEGGRLFDKALGGGGILDIGCYCVSMARLLAGAALGCDIAEPTAVKGLADLHPQDGTDMLATGVLSFAGGIQAQIGCGVQLRQRNTVVLNGTKGRITLPHPWQPGGEGSKIIIEDFAAAEQREESTVDSHDLYAYEVDAFAAAVNSGKIEFPAMTPTDTLGNMRVLDQWRAEAGVRYHHEEAGLLDIPVSGVSLSKPSSTAMRFGMLPGLDKPVAKLVAGGMIAQTIQGQIALDDYFERGGNAFDSGFIYKGCDAALGRWIASRGILKDVVIIAKGAHTPYCNPADLTRQLHQSLENLKTDCADVYIMHRDNLDIPVGEFIDVLNEHHAAGRFKTFGVSNWTIERVVEANAYAKKNGKVGLSLLNNQFSLARMVDPVWADCLSVSDAKSRKWLTANQFPNLSWSSQARGFFTPRAAADKRDNAEMVRCWYADDNFERKRRAAEMAIKKGCSEINIALAYVLSQPFPIWCLIGPMNTEEVASCFEALAVELSDDECRWLNLED